MQVLNTKTNIYPTEKALQHHITHKQSAPGPAHMRSSKGWSCYSLWAHSVHYAMKPIPRGHASERPLYLQTHTTETHLHIPHKWSLLKHNTWGIPAATDCYL